MDHHECDSMAIRILWLVFLGASRVFELEIPLTLSNRDNPTKIEHTCLHLLSASGFAPVGPWFISSSINHSCTVYFPDLLVILQDVSHSTCLREAYSLVSS